MRLMILGASSAQLAGIKAAKTLGHEVVTCDYLPDAVGHGLADHAAYASTFDMVGVLAEARHWQIDGIMTLGTDQPVLTVAEVAKAMGLPAFHSVDTARAVTHKGVMKHRLKAAGIPVTDYLIYKKGVNDGALPKLAYPVVAKPLDSQGQRGVRYLETPEAVQACFEAVLQYSRRQAVLVESYYAHEEVTVSGWVQQGEPHVLAITDRVSFSDKDRIGICLAHEYPSRHTAVHGPALTAMTREIVKVMGIAEGPLYFQFFIGNRGILVNEIACRIGGAYEALYLPVMTGVDLCSMQVKAALGQPLGDCGLSTVDPLAPRGALSVQLFFAEPGQVQSMTPLTQVLALEGVIAAGYNIAEGDCLPPIRDATARAGYVIIQGDSPSMLEQRLRTLYGVLQITDPQGRNLLIHRALSNDGSETL